MSHKSSRGFVLLEVILSIALFSMVATAMVVALDRLAATSTIAQKESRIFRRLNSVITEFVYRPNHTIEPGETRFPADANGVLVNVVVTGEEFLTENDQSLEHMYRIQLTGHLEGEPDTVRTLERVVFSPPDNLQ